MSKSIAEQVKELVEVMKPDFDEIHLGAWARALGHENVIDYIEYFSLEVVWFREDKSILELWPSGELKIPV